MGLQNSTSQLQNDSSRPQIVPKTLIRLLSKLPDLVARKTTDERQPAKLQGWDDSSVEVVRKVVCQDDQGPKQTQSAVSKVYVFKI